MTPETVMRMAREMGIRLELVSGAIRYRPKTVPSEFVEGLRQHGREVAKYLEHRQSYCRACLCDDYQTPVCHICEGSTCHYCGGCVQASMVWRDAEDWGTEESLT